MNGCKLTIALVYDLKSDYASYELSDEELADFDEEEAIFAVESALRSLDHTVVRVGNFVKLVHALATGQHRSWDLVFNVAEGLYGSSREAQVPGLLEAYQIPFTFSDARVLSIVHDKALTKLLLHQHAIPTASFTTVSWKNEFFGFTEKEWLKRLKGSGIMLNNSRTDSLPRLFIKPNQEGSSKGVDDFSCVTTAEDANKTVHRLRKTFAKQDILIEEHLNGREFTVSLIGTGACAKVLGVIELLLPADNAQFLSLYNKNVLSSGLSERIVRPEDDKEVAEVAQIALAAWVALGCRDAGRVDVRSMGTGQNAVPHVIEVNALAGLRPNYSHLAITADLVGYKHVDLIKAIVESACSDVN